MEKRNEGCRVKVFDEHMENYNVEASALHRKLQSKVEALKIMRKELEKFRMERDQFKLMAETLQTRYSAMKKSVCGVQMSNLENMEKFNIAALLNEMREKNLALTTDNESLREKLADMNGDIKVLRAKGIAASSSGKSNEPDTREANWTKEKSDFIAQLECLKKKTAQQQYDLRSMLDDKEEIVTELDAFKCKVHRLNYELNIALKKNKGSQFLDIDALILENKYLQERLSNCEHELEMSQQSANKYKAMLDAKRAKGIIKLGSNSNEIIMSHKQVRNLLEHGTDTELPLKEATIADLKSMCLVVLDNLNDKNLALSHQRKTNKLLADRIADLEQRLHAATHSDENDSTIALSPSQVLLNGYCSSTVDQHELNEWVSSSVGSSSAEQSKPHSDSQQQEPFSPESNNSLVSSEFAGSDVSSEFSRNSAGVKMSCDTTSKALPPDLAKLVEQALQKMDYDDVKSH